MKIQKLFVTISFIVLVVCLSASFVVAATSGGGGGGFSSQGIFGKTFPDSDNHYASMFGSLSDWIGFPSRETADKVAKSITDGMALVPNSDGYFDYRPITVDQINNRLVISGMDGSTIAFLSLTNRHGNTVAHATLLPPFELVVAIDEVMREAVPAKPFAHFVMPFYYPDFDYNTRVEIQILEIQAQPQTNAFIPVSYNYRLGAFVSWSEYQTDLNPYEDLGRSVTITSQVVIYAEDGTSRIVDGSLMTSNVTISETIGGELFLLPQPPTLTWTTISLAPKTVTAGDQDVVLYRAIADAENSPAVTITSVTIHDAGGKSFDNGSITNLQVYINGNLAPTTIYGHSDMYSASISFNMNAIIPAGEAVVFEVRADFADQLTSGNIGITVTNVTSQEVTVNKVNSDVTSREITLASGDVLLSVVLDTTDPKANHDTFILAGTATRPDHYLGALKLTTGNESTEIKTLVLEQHGSATSSDIRFVYLYDENGNFIKAETPSSDGHVSFNDLNITIPENKTTTWYIGVTAKTMNADGDPEGTAAYGRTIQYSIGTITAVGSMSGIEIMPTIDTTDISKIATITGSRLVAITNVMQNSVLATGNDKIIGKYQFVFDNNVNRAMSGEEMKAQLRKLVITLNFTSGVDLTNIQAYVEADAANKTSVGEQITGAMASDGTKSYTFVIDLTTFPNVDGIITLVIEADINVDGPNQYVQTKIMNLATDVAYNGNNGLTDLHLTAFDLGIKSVVGATLTN